MAALARANAHRVVRCKEKDMAKDWTSRVVYGVCAVLGVVALIYGHVYRDAEWSIVGFMGLAFSLFFAHWPLSWKH